MLVPSSESDNGLDFIQIDCFGPDRRERQNTVARGGKAARPAVAAARGSAVASMWRMTARMARPPAM